ncbi:MAG: hypothetical protein H0W40_11630 [Methylibium sp.]|uniref:hypothetical protein n=1 Tax=Methylibium sp. TaxID=2067992 RepID=UPI001806FF8A|nr:hypothetical protein [Methylibium sp.]MBA3598008.1 hypothetical protein [Methylibium sp.]
MDFQRLFGSLNIVYRFFGLSEAELAGLPTLDADIEQTTQALDRHIRSVTSEGGASTDDLSPFETLAKKIRADTNLDHFHFAEQLEFYASYLRNLSLVGRRDEQLELDSGVYATRGRRYLDVIVLRPNHPPLSVLRCTYASPGITDLAGLAQTLGHVKDFVLHLITHRATLHERRLREELLAEELRAARLQNVHKQIELLKSVGYKDIQCRKLLAEFSESAVALAALVDRGLVERVEVQDVTSG